MSDTPARGTTRVSAHPPLRALPAHPRLDFERKQAKALLRALRDADTAALDRARAVGEAATGATWALSDAQRIVAREYGFASWPKLVRWFEALVRQGARGARHDIAPRSRYLELVDDFLRAHAEQSAWTAQALTGYAPRFYGARTAAAFAVTPTRAEAELVIARMHGFESWAMLMAEAQDARRREVNQWTRTPLQLAWEAMEAGDLARLDALTGQHPDLLRDDRRAAQRGEHLMRSALFVERTRGRDAMRPVMQWLEARGFDRQRTLDLQLATMFGQHDLEAHLAQGANPNAVLPNGIPVLEHALLGMWSREAIDRLAAHVTPRTALWISAGLGDLTGMARLLDARGRPLPAARVIRPHIDAVFPGGALAPHPDPTDEELLAEAVMIATMNDRHESVEWLASRGVPMNVSYWGMSPLGFAVGNPRPRTVRALLAHGASPDAVAMQGQTAREIARWVWLDSSPRSGATREVAVLLGWDPEALLAERAAAHPVPALNQRVLAALDRARHDAATVGAAAVEPEHLLMALLSGSLANVVLHRGGLDRERFLAAFGARLDAPETLLGGELPLHARTEAVLAAVQAAGRADARTEVHLHAVLRGLLGDAGVAQLLRDYGTDLDAISTAIRHA